MLIGNLSSCFDFCQMSFEFILNVYNFQQIIMIDIYAIVNQGHPMQTYLRRQKNQLQLQSIITHSIKAIKKGQSKVIKNFKIGSYMVYYFQQGTFIFLMATQITDRIQRMQNYLRVVADIFYENYDEKKFHRILDRTIDQINKIQFGAKKNTLMQDQQSSLVQSTVMMQSKQKISNLINRRNRQSVRAYIIISILFLIYLGKNWD